MYENGRQVNRYANKIRHKQNLKRRHTPLEYKSYQAFVQDMDKWYSDLELPAGYVPYYQRWWKAYTGYINTSWKKQFKDREHSAVRAYYTRNLRALHNDSESDVEHCTKKYVDQYCFC